MGQTHALQSITALPRTQFIGQRCCAICRNESGRAMSCWYSALRALERTSARFSVSTGGADDAVALEACFNKATTNPSASDAIDYPSRQFAPSASKGHL